MQVSVLQENKQDHFHLESYEGGESQFSQFYLFQAHFEEIPFSPLSLSACFECPGIFIICFSIHLSERFWGKKSQFHRERQIDRPIRYQHMKSLHSSSVVASTEVNWVGARFSASRGVHLLSLPIWPDSSIYNRVASPIHKLVPIYTPGALYIDQHLVGGNREACFKPHINVIPLNVRV